MDFTPSMLAEALEAPVHKLTYLSEELLGHRKTYTQAEAMSLAVLWKALRRGHYPKQLKPFAPSLLSHCQTAHWLDLPSELIVFPISGDAIQNVPESTGASQIDEADYFFFTSVRLAKIALLRYLVFTTEQLTRDPQAPLPSALSNLSNYQRSS